MDDFCEEVDLQDVVVAFQGYAVLLWELELLELLAFGVGEDAARSKRLLFRCNRQGGFWHSESIIPNTNPREACTPRAVGYTCSVRGA